MISLHSRQIDWLLIVSPEVDVPLLMDISFLSGRGKARQHSGSYTECHQEGITHPRIYHTRRLYLDDLLHEFDAANPYASRGSVPSLQYVRFHSSHIVPGRYVTWVGDTIGETT